MNSTLILNSDYTPYSFFPISAINWEYAIKICLLEKATAVEFYDEWVVRSPSVSLKVPAVIASKVFLKKRTSIKFSRNNILLRDNFTCQYCQTKLSVNDFTIDHVIPRVKGGKTKWENVVSSCYTCNSIKGHKSTIKPKTKPVKPDYFSLMQNIKAMTLQIPSEKWIPYLDWDRNLIRVVNQRK